LSRIYIIREVEGGGIEAVFSRKHLAETYLLRRSPWARGVLELVSYREGVALADDPMSHPWPEPYALPAHLLTITRPVSPRRRPYPDEEE
jgi:hypothetical protein